MSTRRRRVGSETEQVPFIVTTDYQGKPTSHDNYDKHEGKLKNYPQKQQPTVQSQAISPSKALHIVDAMAARDRTMEFAKAVQSLQSRNITRAVNLRDPRKATQMRGHAEFMMVAKTIGRNVAGTYAKLEKLTILARNKSPFSDGPSEISELTYIIKEDLSSLNQQIAKLQEIAKKQRQMDSSSSRQHLQSHSSNIVLALQSKLASMSTEFKQILEVRTENLKLKRSRQEKFDGSASVAAQARSRREGTLLLTDDQVNIDLEQQGGAMVPLLQSQRQVVYDQTDDYLQSRAETMQNIESTIVELGGIFQQLAHMVKEQEEMVDRIDSNVDATSLNVEAAHSELLKYFQSVTSNRWLMIKIFGLLIFFFVFFVVFMT